jgi:epoxyqueuosine reductase
MVVLLTQNGNMKNILEIERLKEKIIHHAKSLGFDLIGFSPVKVQDKYVKTYKNWLLKHYEGEMFYMQKADSRLNSAKILPGAKSVIVLAINYYQPQEKLSPNCGRIARYAYGRDYHKIIKKKLKQLEEYIQQIDLKHVFRNVSAVQTRSYVDTGPLLERALAEQAGLGVIGKNSCLITRDFGSWVFLAEIIVSIKLHDHPTEGRTNQKNPTVGRHPFPFCGNCTKCIESCPTKAIIAPGIIDARKCISYLTIENKKSIPEKFTKIIKQTKHIFGCDICQEVCPHNIARQKQTIHSELTSPKIAGNQQNLKKIFSIKTDQQFLNAFAGSPLMRAKRRGLRRNTQAVT